MQMKGRLRQIDLTMMSLTHPGADMLGLLLHLLHQPRALDHVGEARIVLDIGGDGELAAGLQPLRPGSAARLARAA